MLVTILTHTAVGEKHTVIVVLGEDLDLVGDEVRRVETDTELSDHGDISSSGESLHKLLGSRTSNGTKVVDEVRLGETNTGILAVEKSAAVFNAQSEGSANIVKVLFSLSGMISIRRSFSESRTDGSERER